MQLVSSVSLPFRKVAIRLVRTPRRVASRIQRIVGGGVGPWALVDIVWRSIFIALQYDRWLKRHTRTTADIASLHSELSAWSYQPLISLIMPVYNSDERWLRKAIDSVRQQVYPHWELCIADDASQQPHVVATVEQYQADDPRIRLVRRQTQGHISAASNSALTIAGGDYVALLDHDDEITVDALFEVVKLLNQHPEADFIYSDEDKLDTTGQRSEPFFKPDWSPLLLRNINYITHFAVIRRRLVEAIGGFRDNYVGSQDHDLFLRVTAHTDRVFHIPKVLYSWRKAATSAALSADIKSYAVDASLRAVQSAVTLQDPQATVAHGSYTPFIRVRYPLTGNPRVSIVVRIHTTTDVAAARAMLEDAAGVRCELVMVTDQAQLRDVPVPAQARLIVCRTSAISEMLQAGANAATGDYLLFAQRPVQPVDSEWLTAMLEYAQRANVACVGAKILNKRHAVISAGIALGIDGSAASIGVGIADVPQLIFYLNLKDAIREVSAVSASCMLVRTTHFRQLGGFDTTFTSALYDVDFCLRAGVQSLRTIFMPYARVLVQHSTPPPTPEDRKTFTARWHKNLDADPYYSVHLSRHHRDMRLRTPPEPTPQNTEAAAP